MKRLKRYTRTVAFMALLGVLCVYGMDTDDVKPAPSIEKPKLSPQGLQTLLSMLEIARFRTQRNYPSMSPNSYMLKSIAKRTHASPDNENNGDDINLSGNEKKLIKRAGSGFFSAAWGDLQPTIIEVVTKYGASILRWLRY